MNSSIASWIKSLIKQASGVKKRRVYYVKVEIKHRGRLIE